MAEKIGLEAILKTGAFESGLSTYLTGLSKMQAGTNQAVQSSLKMTKAGVTVSTSFKQIATTSTETSQKISGFNQALGKINSGINTTNQLLGSFGLAIGISQVVQFTSASHEMARAQNDARNSLTQLLGSSTKYRDAIQQVQTATRGTLSETEAARTAFGLLDNGIAKSAGEAAKYALAGKALNSALGETASYEKFLMLLDEGSPMLMNNFNITQSMVDAQQRLVEANTSLTGSQARLQAIREVALQNGLALAGSISDETIAAQQARAAFDDFQASLGQVAIVIDKSTGATEKATWLFRNMAEVASDGAKAWQYVLNDAIPAINAHNSAVDQSIGKQVAAAKSIEDLQKIQADSVTSWDDVKREIIGASSSFDDYESHMLSLAQINAESNGEFDALLANLAPVREEFDAVKVAIAGAAQVAEKNAYQSMRNLTTASYEAAAAARELAAAQAEQARIQQGISAFGVDTNRERAAYAQLFQARAGQQEALLKFNNETDQKRIEAQRKAEEQSARETEKLQQRGAKAMTKSFDQAAQQIRSTIESVLQPSLDEVWKPPEGAEIRIDEAARRLATVTTAGFGSEWLNQLNTQFAGQDFWKPMADAMKSGDVEALKSAATGILTSSVTNLWDPEIIKAKVREQLQQQKLREQIVQQIQQELAAEGTVISPEQITQIAGGAAGMEQSAAGAGQAVVGIATDATTAQTALDTLGLSLDNVAVTNIPAMITASNDLVIAIQGIGSGITAASPEIITALSTTVEELQTVVKVVKWTELGKAIDQGIAKGISDNEALVLEKLKALMKSAMISAGTAIGYGSPAKEYIPLGQSIPQALALGADKDAGLFQDSLNKLLGVNPDALKVDKVIDAARRGMLPAFSSWISDDKAHLAQQLLTDVFKNNAAEILNATDRLETFRKAAKRAGVSFGFLGATWEATPDRAMSAFLRSFDKKLAQRQKEYIASLMAGAQKAVEIGTSITDLAGQGAGVLNQEVDRLAYLLNTSTGPIEWNGQILDAASATDLLNQKMQEQANIQDDLLRLQEGQSRLSFLKQQLDLVNQLSEVGLNAGDILGGAFGPNASLESIIEASTRAVQALIQHTEGSLAGLQPMSGTQNISNRSSNLTINGMTVSNGMDVNSLIALIQRTAAGVA